MNATRKPRIVKNEPQPFKPQYGFIGGHKIERLPHSPLPHEANIIARVQSMRTRNGVRAEPLSYEASVTYLRNVERVRKHRVTVPAPR